MVTATGEGGQVELRPFHETIVDIIHEATAEELNHSVWALIIMTKIPANHSAILAELIKRVQSGDLPMGDCRVLSASINKQKHEAEKGGRQAEIRRRLDPILLEYADDIEEGDIDADSRIGLDLGIGTIVGAGDFLVLREKIEREFGIKIPAEAIPSYDKAKETTVGQIVEAIDSLKEKI